ncbi:Nose resistant to fluoxetine protein [Ooceraea biroi]|uniref:Nose resistant to fluoxetine protein n=1 Tax=Ooceraea biroi TaxID=2015173 RepID=A0A026WP18_OOCBI|nr:Nose resistant to fluoxetine protein [Ooceraea biroi]
MSYWQFALILCVCTNLSKLFCVSAQAHLKDRLNKLNENAGSYSLPAYAVASTADLLNSTICRKELQDFRDAVDQRILWSLRMLDSSGEPKPGFLYGNNYWLGSHNQCDDTMNTVPLEISKQDLLNNTQYRDPQKEFPPFKVHYLVAYFRHNSTLQYHVNLHDEDIITLGLCLPASCRTSDLSFILERIFYNRSLLIGHIYSADFTLIEVKDLKNDYQWLFNGTSLLIFWIVLVFTLAMMIIGTVYDIFIYQNYLSMKKVNTRIKDLREEVEFIALSSKEESKVGKVLMCFSIYTNTRIIFDTSLSANAIPVIHGLRFLSMGWIIMIHTTNRFIHIDNKIWLWKMSQSFIAQILSNGSISVDTFFFQSGFLVTYLYLKNRTSKEQTKLNFRAKLNLFFGFIIKRFMRLTPTYIMALGIVLVTSSWYDKTSEFYMDERPQETCTKYWWRNLLYINNLFDHNDLCMQWSWYIANDMQFYVIGVALLILSSTYFYTAAVILGALLIGSIVLTGYISYVHQHTPIVTELYKVLNVLYDPPWVRISPYIIGMITAYILIRLNNKLVLKKTTVVLCWCFGSICNILVLFGLYNRYISVLSFAVYVAISRTVWAIGIAWIVIACSTKHGGIVNELLSFRGWIPLSKLTYGAYLLNPFVLNLVHLDSEASVHVGLMSIITIFMGIFATSFLCSYILNLMAETPYALLLRMLTQPRSKKKYKSREIVISSTNI